MAAPTQLDILIQIAARLEGMDQSLKGLTSVRSEAEKLGGALQVGFGVEVVHRFTEALAEIPRFLQEAANEGIKFNALMETSRLGVAGVLKQFDSANYSNFNAALADSDKLIGLLRDKSNQLGLSFESMLEQYRTTAGALFAGGVKDLQKQVDLTVLLQQAMAAVGVPPAFAQRDIIDLLEGRAARTIAGRALGVTDEDIQKASEAGQLYEFLTTRFQSLSQAGSAMSDTFNAATQRAKNLGEQLAGIGTQDVFAILKDSLNGLNELLGREDTKEKIAGIGAEMASVAQTAIDMGKQIKDALDALDQNDPLLGGAALERSRTAIWNGPAPFDYAAQQTAVDHFVTSEGQALDKITQQGRAAQTLTEREAARKLLADQIAAVEQKISNSQGDMQSAAQVILGLLEHMQATWSTIEGHAKQTAGAMYQTAEQIARAQKAAEALAKVRTDVAIGAVELSGDEDRAAELKTYKAGQDTFKGLVKSGVDESQALAIAVQLQQQLTDGYNQEKAVKGDLLRLDEQAIEVLRLRASGHTQEADSLDRVTKIEQEFGKLQREGVTDAQEAWRLATTRVDSEKAISDQKHDQRDSQQAINAMLHEQQSLLEQIKQSERLINDNPFLSADQKNSALLQNSGEQIHALLQSIKQDQEKLDGGTLDPVTYARVQEEIQKMGFDVQDLGLKMQGLSFGGQFQSSLVQWVNSFGSAGQQAANVLTGTLNTAIGATSQAITGLIFQTGNWKQAFAQAGQSIVADIIKIALQYVISKLVMAAIDRVTGGVSSQVAGQAASKAAAQWAPAAVSASIASYGAAAGVGTAAYLLGLATGEAAAVGISSAGGIGGGGAAHEGAIIGRDDNKLRLRGPLSPQERLTRTLVGEGVFTEEQMANLVPLRTDVFSSDQLAAMTASAAGHGHKGGGPGPIDDPSLPPPAGGNDPGGFQPVDPSGYPINAGFPTGPTVIMAPPSPSPISIGSDPGVPSRTDVPAAAPSDDPNNVLVPDTPPWYAVDAPPERRDTGTPQPVVGQSGWEGSTDSFAFLRAAAHLHDGGPIVPPPIAPAHLRPNEAPIVGLIGEHVINQPAVAHYGSELFEAFNEMRIPIDIPRLHDGGAIGGGQLSASFAGGQGSPSRGATGAGAAAPVIHVFNFIDRKEMEQAAVNSDANIKIISDVLKGKAHTIGINLG